MQEGVGGARCSVSETEGKSDGPRLVARLARLVRRQGASGPDLSVSVLLWVGAAPTLGICQPAFDLFRRILAGDTRLWRAGSKKELRGKHKHELGLRGVSL